MKKLKIARLIALTFLCVTHLIPFSAYAKRYALLVGMSKYKESTGWSSLSSVSAELKTVKKLLEDDLGYDRVILEENKSKTELTKIMDRFIAKYGKGKRKKDNQLLFLFSGHGYTEELEKSQVGYFMPYDAPNKSKDEDAFYELSIDLSFFTHKAEIIQAKQALFLFDSCFSGSIFNQKGEDKGVEELKRAEKLPSSSITALKPARYFITAGAADQMVPAKSIFIPTLVNALKHRAADYNHDGYVTSQELGMYLEDQVTRQTKKANTPRHAPLFRAKYQFNKFMFDVSSMSPLKPDSKKGKGESDEMRRLRAEIEALKKEQEKLKADLKKSSEVSPPGPIITPRVPEGKAGIAWVRIPDGSFMMGSSEGLSDAEPHRVRVRSFLMSKTEVTVGQYRKCVEAGRCTEPDTDNKCNWGESGREDHPINCVDWGQARTFAKWVGADVDLPTEAEWEYAARGGQSFKYAGSNDADEVAWYFSSITNMRTCAVGTKTANGFGLHDMSGNVWEWTLDEYHNSYSGAPSDGSAWGTIPTCKTRCDSGSTRRVFRGGSWSGNADFLRVAIRGRYSPDARWYNLGFRLRRTLP